MATKKKAKKSTPSAPLKKWEDVEPRVDHPKGFRTEKVQNESGETKYRHVAL